MSYWYLEYNNTKLSTEFNSESDAITHRQSMGKVFESLYSVKYECDNPKHKRMINEGLVKNDLEDILLPILSIDEYVPSDPNTDNIVVAFFIKGVPEAVLPFQHFCEKCNGVLLVDHGDSDTIKETSLVYLEFDRQKMKPEYIEQLMELVSLISGLEPEDFSMKFPHTNKKFPYDIKLLNEYLESRTRKENMIAQQKAEKKAQAKKQQELDSQPSPEEVEEAMINSMVSLI